VRTNRLTHIAQSLHTLSLRHNMTQADICRATGLGRDSMSRYFRGLTVPDALSLTKMSRALTCTPRTIDPGASEILVPAPSAPTMGPAFEVTADPDRPDRMFLRINRPVSFVLAAKVMVLIEEYSRAEHSAPPD